MRGALTDVFPIFWRLGLGSLALRQKSQSTTEAFFFPFFPPPSCARFSFLSLWTVDDHSPQLLISQYTRASIRKRANTQPYTHTRAIPPQFS